MRHLAGIDSDNKLNILLDLQYLYCRFSSAIFEISSAKFSDCCNPYTCRNKSLLKSGAWRDEMLMRSVVMPRIYVWDALDHEVCRDEKGWWSYVAWDKGLDPQVICPVGHFSDSFWALTAPKDREWHFRVNTSSGNLKAIRSICLRNWSFSEEVAEEWSYCRSLWGC